MENKRPSGSIWLDEFFGCEVPKAFITLMNRIEVLVDGDRARFFRFVDEVFGIARLSGFEQRHPGTPAEFFPFGATGVDGVSYGFVIHAPELKSGDPPLGQYSPMDSGGIYLLGTNATEAFENLASTQFSFEIEFEDDEIAARIKALSNQIGLRCEMEFANRRYTPEGNGREIVPNIPGGWSFSPTSDGIGVLAPESMFERPTELPTNWAKARCESNWLSTADRHFERQKFATALVIYRELMWSGWSDREQYPILAQRMIALYQAMDRPALAAVLQRMLRA
ncbi:MAG TPA: hypothetical protein PK402_01970 [Tepidisphaeraceae bacterium]|nr:hypothetical protein [Tepidisphaeraceae bacterium]